MGLLTASSAMLAEGEAVRLDLIQFDYQVLAVEDTIEVSEAAVPESLSQVALL